MLASVSPFFTVCVGTGFSAGSGSGADGASATGGATGPTRSLTGARWRAAHPASNTISAMTARRLMRVPS